MADMFKLAPNLSLPASAVTETSAFFGTRGTGKTYGCGKQVEEFHDGGAQVVVVDPVGVWYGLRIAANGRARGLDIPVFGGLHGDVPLEPTGGDLVARLVVEKRISVVLDISMFTLGQQHRFVTVFATALFNLKKANRSPLHIVIDEAHEFLPQFVQGNEAEMVGAVRRLSKMGRNFGIGLSLISPRPAEVNKGSVNITERMYCGRLKGPQDRKAIEAWASSNDADASVLEQLPTLANGDLIAWTDKGPTRVRFLPKRTFDASKTPEAGDVKPSVALPKIDLDEVREAMAATIEEAKANDPKALRAKIAELEHAAKMTPAPKPTQPEKAAKPPREVSVFREADLKRIERLADKLGDREQSFKELVATAVDRIAQAQQVVVSEIGHLVTMGQRAMARPVVSGSPQPIVLPRAVAAHVRTAPVPRPVATDGAGGELGRCPRALLGVLAQRGVATASQVATLSGYRVTSSTFSNGLSALRVAGYVRGGNARLEVTDEGRQMHGPIEPLPKGPALLGFWMERLTKCEGTMLKVVYDAGGSIGREDLATASGYSVTSSTFSNGLSGLRVLELVEGGTRGEPVRIAEVFGAQ